MVELKETEELEYKKSTQLLEEAIISIASILNKNQHGKIVFGVKDDGQVVGVDIGKDSLRKISRAISQNIEPKIYPKIYTQEYNNKNIIIVEFKGNDLPYFAYGKCYMRVADEDRGLSVGEIKKLIHKVEGMNWDKQLSDCTIKDINEETVKLFMMHGNLAKRIKDPYTTKKDILNKIEVLQNNQLTNAGKYLFCDKASVPLKLAVFATEDNQTFLDINRLEGNIFNLIEEGLSYVKKNMQWKIKFSDQKLERIEIPEIPIKALREAIINSFLHCDYLELIENSIAIYKNRIEIINAGSFLGTSSISKYLKGEGHSVCRNKSIAKIMYLSDDVESWGTGLKRIYEECQKERIDVEFLIGENYFKTIFYRPGYQKDIDNNLPELSTQEKDVIHYIEENGYITRRQIEELLEIKERRARVIINNLINKNIIIGKGKTNNLIYELKN